MFASVLIIAAAIAFDRTPAIPSLARLVPPGPEFSKGDVACEAWYCAAKAALQIDARNQLIPAAERLNCKDVLTVLRVQNGMDLRDLLEQLQRFRVAMEKRRV